MNVSIIAATDALNYRLLDNKLNELIESSGCYLFNILCGFVEGDNNEEKSLGELWAKNNGAPVIYIKEKTVDKLIDRMILKTDYAIFILDEENPIIKKIFMRYKMAGKHGSVIKK